MNATAFAAALLLAWSTLSSAAECAATSGARRVALLELYTSEGCDSCPPADRWVSALAGRGLTTERVVTLAFHVDYWNSLGWVDPYAKAEFTERQRLAARRNTATFVYTPQLLLNGRNYRRGMLRDDFDDRVAGVNRETPEASIRIFAREAGATLLARSEARVSDARRPGAVAYLALYEDRLATQVSAGENRGRRLLHDHVVRELAGPFRPDASGSFRFEHPFHLDPSWKKDDLRTVAFIQHESGEILQALALDARRCAPGRRTGDASNS